jgi:phage gp29-like protein
MVTSAILDRYGRPMERPQLGVEIATPTLAGVRGTLADRVASGLTPERLAAVLRRAETGEIRDYLTLAEEMEERYLHYASQVQTRRLAIETVELSLQVPKGVPTKVADAVRSLLESPDLLEAAGALTDGIAKGLSIVEMAWEYERGALRPVKYTWRDPRYFRFDRLSMTELRLASDTNMDGEPLPAWAFMRHLPRSKMGIPIRRGFARAATWAFLFQSFALKDWAAFAEIYGIPLRVGSYHPGASEKDKRTLLRAVAGIASDAAAIIPQGMTIDFHEVKGSQGESVFGSLTAYLDRQISKLVVGQTMTSDDGSSEAQAKVHNEVRLDILKADCRQLANTINRDLIEPFVLFNFGPQDAFPVAELPVAEPEDIKELTEAVARLVPLGLKVGQRDMRERIGISEPAPDEDVLAVRAAEPAEQDAAQKPPSKPLEKGAKKPAGLAAGGGFAHPRGCACGGCRAFAALAADGDGIDVDAELEALLAEGLADWEDLADPVLEPLRAALAAATSFDDLIAALPEVARKGGGNRLAERLARLAAIARGLGDVAD